MLHRSGGPGQRLRPIFAPIPPLSMKADHLVLSALERWAEEGKAASEIVAAKYANDNPALGSARTRLPFV
jgi:feruloyl esterase